MSIRAAALLLLAGVAASCGTAEPPDVDAALFEVSISGCQLNVSNRATATAIADGLVLTVAHSFEDASEVALIAPDGTDLAAQLVYVDSKRDIALLAFDTGSLPDIETLEVRSDDADPAASGRIVVHRDQGTVLQSVELLRRTLVTLDGEGERQGIELGGVIEPGDSGAPVIDDDTRLIGMVFASSRTAETGWAVAGSELLDIASLAGVPIPLTCATG